MSKAALNTIMGLGVVFADADLHQLDHLAASSIIHEAEERADCQEEGSDRACPGTCTSSQQSQWKRRPADDLELVAVIAAAIAASEGTDSEWSW